jgi:hypothetical protein
MLQISVGAIDPVADIAIRAATENNCLKLDLENTLKNSDYCGLLLVEIDLETQK